MPFTSSRIDTAYAEFGRPYDLQVLEAVRGAQLNILHVCDSHNMLLDLADYPLQAFNWAATDPTNPSLAATRSLPGLRIGGLGPDALTAEDAGRVRTISAPSVNTIYIRYDERSELRPGGAPFADKRLRLAVDLSIDRKALSAIYANTAPVSLGQMGVPGDFGYNPNLGPRRRRIEWPRFAARRRR